jgi:hypothetical protein
VPVYLHRPFTDSDNDVLPVQDHPILGGAAVAGVKPPWAFSLVLSMLQNKKKFPLLHIGKPCPHLTDLFFFFLYQCGNNSIGKNQGQRFEQGTQRCKR